MFSMQLSITHHTKHMSSERAIHVSGGHLIWQQCHPCTYSRIQVWWHERCSYAAKQYYSAVYEQHNRELETGTWKLRCHSHTTVSQARTGTRVQSSGTYCRSVHPTSTRYWKCSYRVWQPYQEGCPTKMFPIYLKVKLLSEKERRADILRNNPKMYKVSTKVSKDTLLEPSRTL